MIKDILKSALVNFQSFLVTWVIIIVLNQLFIFGACFAPYCLIAALPHTFIIAILVHYFFIAEELNTYKTSALEEELDSLQLKRHKSKVEEDKTPSCPKCGSNMVLRTARKGRHVGNEFWGCSKYPNCYGILKNN